MLFRFETRAPQKRLGSKIKNKFRTSTLLKFHGKTDEMSESFLARSRTQPLISLWRGANRQFRWLESGWQKGKTAVKYKASYIVSDLISREWKSEWMTDGECGLNDDDKSHSLCKISESGKVFLILIRLFVGRLYNRRDALSRPDVEQYAIMVRRQRHDTRREETRCRQAQLKLGTWNCEHGISDTKNAGVEIARHGISEKSRVW